MGSIGATIRKLRRELNLVENCDFQGITDISAYKDDLRCWTALLLPSSIAYNKGAFRVLINFPDDYPLNPPTVRMLTRIYHPNVDIRGRVCLPILVRDNWRRWMRMKEVLQQLGELLDLPDLAYAANARCARNYVMFHKLYLEKAMEMTKEFALRRPIEATNEAKAEAVNIKEACESNLVPNDAAMMAELASIVKEAAAAADDDAAVAEESSVETETCVQWLKQQVVEAQENFVLEEYCMQMLEEQAE